MTRCLRRRLIRFFRRSPDWANEIVGEGAVNYYLLSALAARRPRRTWCRADRRTTLMTIPIAGDFDEASVNVKEVMARWLNVRMRRTISEF